ncbi:MAG: FtsW/RodA/SpoVE family cell cycle protein [Anaerolineae bacterium]|jgi:cell division protein FtsW|nr:FtsW/RodA/SpoVE family cell cycle protein [Anaerolineae bacterium]
MTDQSVYGDTASRPRARAVVREITPPAEVRRVPEARVNFLATLDKPLLLIVTILVAIGAGMVYSTTFDWSYQTRGSNTAFFVEQHLVNVAVAVAALVFFAIIDYRFWKRFAVLLLIGCIAALVAVWIFGDDTFGARRSLIAGRFQPGELAEFTIVVYMAAWLGSRSARPHSIAFGLIPFGLVVGIITGLLALQPDLSTAIIVGATGLVMYFLAGARILHLATVLIAGAIFGFVFVETQPYAQERITSYVDSLTDPTRASYHTQQAIIAFVKGGWLGRGLGQSEQKFGFLPAPHTDSIFAVIGEELGVVGASVVVMLFVAFVVRGFQIARRAVDPFGSLLTIGFTMWVAVQSMLNIAVMTAVVPASGLPLPFISYGGSSLLMLMTGVGLMLSVSRVAALRQSLPGRSKHGATYDWSRGNGRARVSRPERRRGAAQPEDA